MCRATCTSTCSSHLNIAGRNGQFRTPRHIIRMMVQMIDPKPRRAHRRPGGGHGRLPGQRLPVHPGDSTPRPRSWNTTRKGWPHHLIGDLLTDGAAGVPADPRRFRGFDNDSGMTMLRIGSMNLMLHGIESPQFFYMDTLSKAFDESASTM